MEITCSRVKVVQPSRVHGEIEVAMVSRSGLIEERHGAEIGKFSCSEIIVFFGIRQSFVTLVNSVQCRWAFTMCPVVRSLDTGHLCNG